MTKPRYNKLIYIFINPLQNTDVDTMTSFNHTRNSRATGTLQRVGSEALQQNCNSHDNDVTNADQEVPLMETPLQHGNSIQKLKFVVRIHGQYPSTSTSPQTFSLKVDYSA